MPQDFPAIATRFQAIVADILGAEDLPVHPYFYRYRSAVSDLAGAARFVRYQADLLECAGVSAQDAEIVDAGCGFGFTLIVYALLGVRRIRGIEINAEMVSSIEAYLPLLPADISSRIEVCQGDVVAMPYESASADILLSVEAISHYLDVAAFIEEARRVVRKGGLLIISDGNNGLNPVIRRRTYDIWDAVERGRPGGKAHGHQLGPHYEAVRRQALDEHFSSLSDETRAEIARRTVGFTEEQLMAAAREHEQTGALPNSTYRRRQVAVAPDGTAMERLFSPTALARTLGRHGFSARAYGYWGGAGGASAIRTANRVLSSLSPVTIPFAPSFRVVARRTRDGSP
jgi:SAM-dependent methyltransferase